MRADETGRPFYSQQLHKHPQNMNKTCTKLPYSHRLNLEPTEEENWSMAVLSPENWESKS